MTALVLLLSLGCAPMVARTSGAVVTGSLASLEDPENQARLRLLLTDPAVAEAAQRLAEAALTGTLDTLDDDERAAVLQRRSQAFVDALAPRLAAVLRSDLGPAVRAELALAVQESVTGLTKDPARSDLISFAAALSGAVTRTIGDRLWASTSEGLQTQLGPAAALTLREHLGPALAAVLQEQLLPAAKDGVPPLVAETARLATREMLVEINAALKGELGQTLRADRDATFASVEAMVAAREEAAEVWFRGASVVAVVFGALASLLGWLWWRARKESAARLATVELVTGVIKQQAERDPAARGLARAVRDTGKDTQAGAWLSQFLSEKTYLKVDTSEGPEQP